MIETPMKKCTGPCGRTLPATEEYFYPKKGGKYGLTSRCKECERAYTAGYKAAHREEVRAYYMAHREETIVYLRAYYNEHREKHRAFARAYRAAHRDKIHAYKSSPRRRLADRVYSHRRRARERSLPDTFTAADLKRAHEYWGGICPCCGKQVNDLFGDIQPHMDHWIPLTSPDCPGTVPTNMIPLCDKCNSSKRDRDPKMWLIERFGKRRAAEILRRIDEYFDWIKAQE